MPFGLLGRMATADFKQRLREHYHNSNFENPTGAQARQEDEINMNRFLLDYVLDLGPAAPKQRRNDESPPQAKFPERETLSSNEDNHHDVEMKALPTGNSSMSR